MLRGSVQKIPQSRRDGQYPVLKNGALDRGADRIHIIEHCHEVILGLAPQLTAPCVTQTVELRENGVDTFGSFYCRERLLDIAKHRASTAHSKKDPSIYFRHGKHSSIILHDLTQVITFREDMVLD